MRFKDEATEDIWNGNDTRKARARLPQKAHVKAARLIDRINAAQAPMDLREPRGNRLETLAGDRAGQWSIRINEQYRICFAWLEKEAVDVEVRDYH